MRLNNNVYNGIISLKNQLTKSISEQNSLIDFLTNAMMLEFDDAIDSATAFTFGKRVVTLNTGEAISIEKPRIGDFVEMGWDKEINGQQYGMTFSYNFDELLELFSSDRLFPEELVHDVDIAPTCSFKQVLFSLGSGETINEAIAKVNELFLLNPKVSNSDALNAIDTVKGATGDDINTLKTNLLNCSVEGKVSNYGWLSLISNMCTESKDTVDGGSLLVSKESFFALQDFMNTVLTIASAILEVVFVALAAIFGALIYLVKVAFDAITSLFTATFDTDYKFNVDATYPGIRGTYYAGKMSSISDILGVEDRQVIRISNGAEDIFCYKQFNGSDFDVYVQSQPILAFHPGRLVNYLRNVFQVSVTPVSETYNLCDLQVTKPFSPNWDENLPDTNSQNYPFLKIEDYIQMGLDKDFMIDVLKVNVIMGLVGRIRELQDGQVIRAQTMGVSEYAETKALKWLASVYNTNGTSHNMLENFSLDDIRQIATKVVSMGSSSNADYEFTYTPFGQNNLFHAHFNNYPISVIKNEDYSNIIGISSIDNSLYINDQLQDYYSDSIPTENMIVIPSLDVEQIVKALAIVASVTVATIIAGKRIYSALKAKKQVRQSKRIGTLNELRTAYVQDPDNDQKRKAYTKAVSQYNFKASMFGWGSYDAANGWQNAVSTNVPSTTASIDNAVTSLDAINKIKVLISN